MRKAFGRYGRKILLVGIIAGGLFFIASIVAVNFFLEPALRKGLHTVIINGSDSIYKYSLGSLQAGFFGGKIEVRELHITIDSARFSELEAQNRLPATTIELHLQKGLIQGIGVFSFLFSKRISIEEILSQEANIRIFRHTTARLPKEDRTPLWKKLQPTISSIEIDKVNLAGIKFLLRNSDTAASMKFQFDRIEAIAEKIKIDSASWSDTTRIGPAENVTIKLNDIKFRTADSSYKMKAEWITFSSKNKTLEIDSFKLQPTLEKDQFYEYYGQQTSLYYLEFQKAICYNMPLEKFLNADILEMDSAVIVKPEFSVYLDKTQERKFSSKIGSYPHQKLLKMASTVRIGKIITKGANITYTEKNGKTGEEGKLELNKIDLALNNATNDSMLILKNPHCTAQTSGFIFGKSPININFTFYLDSINGRFDAEGMVRNVSAAQINTISMPLANTRIPTLNLQELKFKVRADDFTAYSDVDMIYQNLSVQINKIDKETGEPVVMGFITRAVNNQLLVQNNGAGGRSARGARYMRLTTTAFFGVIWKSIFAGMQQVMMRI